MSEKTTPAMALGHYGREYRDRVKQAISFAGLDHDVFVEIKAKELLEIALDHLGDTATIAMLDVGCGIGLMHPYIAGRVARLEGADVSASAIEEAARVNLSVRYVCSSGAALPHADGSFDLVFGSCVLQMVPERRWGRIVEEMARVVRDGGLVVIFEHNPWNPLTRLAVRRWSESSSSLVPLGGLQRLVGAMRLEVIESRTIALFPSTRSRLRALERRLGFVPLGAQYVVVARRLRTQERVS